MAALTQVWPSGPAFSHLPYKGTVKLFAVDDGITPSQPGWVTLADISTAVASAALTSALPAVNGLLAGTGQPGAVKAATKLDLAALLTAWAATAPTTSPGDGSPWLNGGLLSFAKS